MDLSVVIPVYNEAQNISELYRQISAVLAPLKRSYEIIFVDDGSRDNTFEVLSTIQLMDNKLKLIKFRKNFGQSAALDAGFKQANGKLIVTLDGDLQNDPNDIPRLLTKLNEGYDVVSGWRYSRKDSVSKRFFSFLSRELRYFILRDSIHDSGCTLKIYKKECFENLDIYGELHRFIPILLKWRGFKVAEIKVDHHPRRFGKTNYSGKRLLKGFLDLLVVKFWVQYSTRPIYLFGSLGLILMFLGGLIGGYLVILKFIFEQGIANRPLLLLVVILILGGIQLFMFGILADIMIKGIYSKQLSYKIERII